MSNEQQQHKVRNLENGNFFRVANVIADMGLGFKAGWTYTGLARFANAETHECLPSIATLAKHLGVSPKFVKEGLADLEQARLIVRKNRTLKGFKTSNVYTLLHVESVDSSHRAIEKTPLAPVEPSTPVQIDPPGQPKSFPAPVRHRASAPQPVPVAEKKVFGAPVMQRVAPRPVTEQVGGEAKSYPAPTIIRTITP